MTQHAYSSGPARETAVRLQAHIREARQRENNVQRDWCQQCATCQLPIDGHERCGGENVGRVEGCGILTGSGHDGGHLTRGLCGSCRTARRRTPRRTVVLGGGLAQREMKEADVQSVITEALDAYRGDLGSGDPAALASFGFEWRVGGHAFQLSFSNAHGTTPAQVARGQQGVRDWFIGFNLTRKFY